MTGLYTSMISMFWNMYILLFSAVLIICSLPYTKWQPTLNWAQNFLNCVIHYLCSNPINSSWPSCGEMNWYLLYTFFFFVDITIQNYVTSLAEFLNSNIQSPRILQKWDLQFLGWNLPWGEKGLIEETIRV